MLCFNNTKPTAGIFELPVTNLTQPDVETRLIRNLDSQFLERLQIKMLGDPSAPGVPPVAVNCLDVQVKCMDNFLLRTSYAHLSLGMYVFTLSICTHMHLDIFALPQSVTEFEDRLKYVYKYEVLGGLHTTVARADLHKEYPDKPIFSQILAEVYVGLSDDEALRLSSRHNVNGHFIHKMTHRDHVSIYSIVSCMSE